MTSRSCFLFSIYETREHISSLKMLPYLWHNSVACVDWWQYRKYYQFMMISYQDNLISHLAWIQILPIRWAVLFAQVLIVCCLERCQGNLIELYKYSLPGKSPRILRTLMTMTVTEKYGSAFLLLKAVKLWCGLWKVINKYIKQERTPRDWHYTINWYVPFSNGNFTRKNHLS